MAKGQDTGDHPHRKVDRRRFESSDDHLDAFSDYAIRKAGVTPDSSTWDIEDAATRFVDEHLGYDGEHRDRLIDGLTHDYHDPDEDY